jgi:hypothetical protein
MNTRSPSSPNHHDDGRAAPKVELRVERVGRTLRYQLIIDGHPMASRPLAGAGRLLGDALVHLMLTDLHRRPSDCHCNAGPVSTARARGTSNQAADCANDDDAAGADEDPHH